MLGFLSLVLSEKVKKKIIKLLLTNKSKYLKRITFLKIQIIIIHSD